MPGTAAASPLLPVDPSLADDGLAAEVAMSPRHFERCFKEAVGSTPRRFLIEVRLGAEGMRLWRLARGEATPWLFRAPLRALPQAGLEWADYVLTESVDQAMILLHDSGGGDRILDGSLRRRLAGAQHCLRIAASPYAVEVEFDDGVGVVSHRTLLRAGG